MKDYVNEYLEKCYREKVKKPFKSVECVDGFKMSIQAGEYLYCDPRLDDCVPYREVEVGFPNRTPKLKEFRKYAEDKEYKFFHELKRLFSGVRRNIKLCIENKKIWLSIYVRSPWSKIWNGAYCETIYPYIPVEIVNKEIELHGGTK